MHETLFSLLIASSTRHFKLSPNVNAIVHAKYSDNTREYQRRVEEKKRFIRYPFLERPESNDRRKFESVLW